MNSKSENGKNSGLFNLPENVGKLVKCLQVNFTTFASVPTCDTALVGGHLPILDINYMGWQQISSLVLSVFGRPKISNR